MKEKIVEFLDSKGINDEFIRNIVTGFITRHMQLYGDVISFEELIGRLNDNLTSIVLKDPSLSPNDNYKNVVARYEGFSKNTISLFFSESDLQNPKLREDFIGILLHELTHCAYTIKQNDIYKSEKQLFATFEERPDGKTPLVNGHDVYMEPIVNYVSSRIFGRKNGLYLSQTINFSKLASMLNEKKLIHSAFYSNETEFKECFKELPEGAYEYFTDGMKLLNYGSEIGYRRGNEIINNFFIGNIPDLSKKESRIKDVKSIKDIPIEPLNNNTRHLL